MMKRFLRWGVGLFLFVFIFIALLYFILPPLFSSGFAREQASTYLTKTLKRPVTMEHLAFSWEKGVAISELNITTQDQSPLLVLHSFQLLPDWWSLLTRKIEAFFLAVEGIELTIIRDKTGKIITSNLSTPSPKKKPGFAYKDLFALVYEAHIKGGVFTFIDNRLHATTQIKDFSADVNIQSLTKPINFFLQSTVILNDAPPEPLKISGSILLSHKEKFDLSKARGTIALKAGFGHLESFFDLDKFNSSAEVTGGRLVCSLDLSRLSRVLAGIMGFPPEFSWKGRLESFLEARGNFKSHIAVRGATRLTGLSITAETFRGAPFEQPLIDFSQDILFNFPSQKIEVKAVRLHSDFLKLFLSGTINNFQKDPYSKLVLSGNVNLHEAVQILRNFFHLPPELNLSGATQLFISGTGRLKNFNLKGTTVVKSFIIEHPLFKGHPLQEDILQISHNFLCNLKKTRFTITSLLIRGKSFTGEIKGALDSQRNIDLQGAIALNFSELKKQLFDVLPRAFPSQGESSSDFTIKGNLKNSLSVKGNHDLPLLPKLKITHDLMYSPEQATLTFTTLKAESPCLNFSGQGTIAQVSKNPFAKCEGKLLFALEEFQKEWKDSFPEKLILKGKGNLAFTAEGNLKSLESKPALSSWNGNADLLVDSIIYQGLGTIQNLKSTKCNLKKGILDMALVGLLNNGPSTVQGTIDFNQKKPLMKLQGEGNDIELSKEQTVLGYVIPISSHSTELTGQGSFFLQASWQGSRWEPEINRSIIGEGKISLNDGTIKSEGALSEILSVLGKSDTIQFDQILSPFRLGEGKIYENTIRVTGKDIELELQGWTSLIYDPEKKGNPLKYKVTGDSLKKSLGRDAQKILPFLGNSNATIPIVITGTVQKPKVSVKFPKAKKFFKEFLNPSRDSVSDLRGA